MSPKGETDVLDDGLALFEGRLLLEDSHRVAGGEVRLSVGDVLETRHDLEQRGLACAVGTHDADLGARVHAHRHVVENDLVAMRLARLVELVHEFGHVCSLKIVSVVRYILREKSRPGSTAR